MGVMLDNLRAAGQEAKAMLWLAIAWIIAILGGVALAIGLLWLRAAATVESHAYSAGLSLLGFLMLGLATKIGLKLRNESKAGV